MLAWAGHVFNSIIIFIIRRPIMETVKNIRMNIFCSIYALFFTFCLYKNYSGVTFPFFATGTLCFFLYYMKRQGLTIKRFSVLTAAVILVLSINICLTDSIYLAVFDRCFIFLLFFTLFLTNLYDDSTWDASRYAAAIVSTICSMLIYLPTPIQDFLKKRPKHEGNDENKTKEPSSWPFIILGLVITLPILLIVLPLLASSDAVFSNLLEQIFSIDLDPKGLRTIMSITVMITCVFFISYALICRLNDRIDFLDKPVPDRRTKNPLVAITISVVLLMVYGLYCAIQVIYLFMGYGTLPKGYTYAEYVHEGFYQLVFVCIINLILVLMCRKYSRESTVLKVMLTLISACTFIMIFSSAYRMMLYIGAYGLTFLRLFVLWTLVVIGLTMSGTCVYIYLPRIPFYKYSLMVLTLTWAVFSLARPDYHIAKFNLTHDFARDEYYITNNLSADAAPAVYRYASDELAKDFTQHVLSKKQWHRTYPCHYVDGKYELPEMNFRTFNYSLYILVGLAE